MITKPSPAIRTAKGLVSWWLARTGYRGITLPPFGIFMAPGSESDTGLIKHEMVHWAQYQRMGAVRFYATYLWFQVRYGYEKNPMEIEARQISGHR
jgi:hypothetical protein